MIVKNEEKFLDNCLESVSTLVDEKIIVDTGSTDSTVEIAKKHGAKVFTDIWHDDFSRARNYSLRQASGDWILVLDGDEELCAQDIKKVEPLLKDTRFKAYLLQIINRSINDKNPINRFNGMTHRNPRLFRNNPSYSFQGIIHEEIDLSQDELNLKFGEAPIRIIHYGYDDDSEKEKEIRRVRNEKLLSKALLAEPANPTLNYYMGDAYSGQNKWEEALACFRLSRANFDPNGYLQPLVYQNIICCLTELGRFREALVEIHHAPRDFANFSEIYFLEGEIYAKLNQPRRALECFKQCIKVKKTPSIKSHETGVDSAAVFGVGICSMILNLDDQAEEAFSECLSLDPSDAVSLEYLGHILLKHHSPSYVKSKLENLADLSCPAIIRVMQKLSL